MAVTTLRRDDTTDYVEIYRGLSIRRKWRWRMKAVNGAKIGRSEQGRVNRTDMMMNLERVTDRTWWLHL